jgi:hypothetical protein
MLQLLHNVDLARERTVMGTQELDFQRIEIGRVIASITNNVNVAVTARTDLVHNAEVLNESSRRKDWTTVWHFERGLKKWKWLTPPRTVQCKCRFGSLSAFEHTVLLGLRLL